MTILSGGHVRCCVIFVNEIEQQDRSCPSKGEGGEREKAPACKNVTEGDYYLRMDRLFPSIYSIESYCEELFNFAMRGVF